MLFAYNTNRILQEVKQRDKNWYIQDDINCADVAVVQWYKHPIWCVVDLRSIHDSKPTDNFSK